jgi:hypothetical protein
LGSLHPEQDDWAQTYCEVVVVEVMVDTDVVPVAPHLVIGASQAVVHPAFSSRLLAPPTVVVAIAVQCTLQLLTVWSVQEEDEEDSVSVDEDCLEAGLDDFGSSTSLSASTIGFRLCCNFFTVSTVSFVPLVTSSFNLLVVSTTQLRSEKAVWNKPPKRLRGRSCPGSLRRRCPLHGSTPSAGFGNLPIMSTALGWSLPSSLVTAVTLGASGVSIQLLRSGKILTKPTDRSEALDRAPVPLGEGGAMGMGGGVIPGVSCIPVRSRQYC